MNAKFEHQNHEGILAKPNPCSFNEMKDEVCKDEGSAKMEPPGGIFAISTNSEG